jgi:hypothetical protein
MKLYSTVTGVIDRLKADWMLLRLPSVKSNYVVQCIESKPDLEAACYLLYTEYRRRNYCMRSALELHFSPYMFARHSRTFVIKEVERLLGTISIFLDGEAGVPSEELYPQKIAEFRNKGHRLAEVGLLATDMRCVSGYSLSSTRKMLVVFSMFKVMVNYALSRGVTHLLIAVNPKHEQLYTFLGFEHFGEVKSYSGACGAPALPMILKLEHFKTRRSTRQWFLNDCFPAQLFSDQLKSSPDAFAELFGESYHAFRDRYYAPQGTKDQKGPTLVLPKPASLAEYTF